MDVTEKTCKFAPLAPLAVATAAVEPRAAAVLQVHLLVLLLQVHLLVLLLQVLLLATQALEAAKGCSEVPAAAAVVAADPRASAAEAAAAAAESAAQ